MSAGWEELSEDYAAAMRDYLERGGEPALRRAYELGRRALGRGVGVLGLAAIHQSCLTQDLLKSGRDPEARESWRALNFLTECLSCYEMALRGFQETNSKLNQSVEELQLVEEELRRQNRRLIEAHREIQAERRRYQDLFELAPDGYLVTDLGGTIREANSAAAVLLSQGVLAGRSLLDFVTPDDRDTVRERLAQIESGNHLGRIQNWQIWLEPKSGAQIAVALTVDIERHSGALRGLRWLLRDVTERIRMEEERAQLLVREEVARTEAEASRRFEFLAEASSLLAASLESEASLAGVARLVVPFLADRCIVILLQPDGTVRLLEAAQIGPITANFESRTLLPEFPALMQSEPQIFEPVTEAVLDAIAGDSHHREVLRKAGLRSALVVPLVARDCRLGAISFLAGESRRSYNASDLALAEDLAHRCALAIENARLYQEVISERDKAEKASRAKDEFLAILSHELKNPLMPILGWARFFKNQDLIMRDPILAEGVKSWERNARHISRLVDDCLDFSRISERKIQMEWEPVNLNQAVLASVEAVRHRTSEKGLTLTVQPSESPLWSKGDADRLRQIFMNLLTNAVKYTGAQGTILVRSAAVDGEAEIEVKDTGIGIAPESLELIFEPFRQATSTWLTSDSSLGLGLAIARQLVSMHNGRIWAESEGLGKGSSFHVRLPLVVQPQESERNHDVGRAHDAAGIRPQRVLLIDDSRDVIFLMKVELEWLGYSVLTATDGLRGLELARREKPGLVISDIRMPGIDGYELIREIRSDPGLSATRAIALTGFGMKADVERAMAAGFDACLTKPPDSEQLLALIEQLTKK